ncbi:protein starmaker-like [Actinia tenebrosa]|uniref:Protein starmaker-like n=1 Tax=Actinia tenebrosa TaxID=6105 RepID=A0A6P8J206_ACTTE|nr:protein starmaker-like [Actinia tenebrosa]
MAEKHDDHSGQVKIHENVNSDSPSASSPTQTSTDISEDSNQNTDLDMKRALLSRASTLESIKEEDSELEERLLLESFKSITDIFENGGEEEQVPIEKSSPAETPLTSKSVSLSISEDTDSLDEEVRQIMLKSEDKQRQSHEATNQVAINSLRDNVAANNATNFTKDVKENDKEKVKEVEEEIEEVPEEDYSDADEESEPESSVATDTESLSESEPDSELESLDDDDVKTGHWSPRDDGSSDDDDFDLEEHINKLCSHTIDSGSSSESESEGSDSEAEKQKAVNKVMRKYAKKHSQDDEAESEDDSDNSDVEETDLEDEGSDDGIEEVEVKDDDDSDYSSTDDDDTDSDFLDEESASVSTASSGDYEIEEGDDDKEPAQGVNEEIPYLSDTTMPSHEVVYDYYLGTRPESCPEKIEVQDGDLNNNIALDNTLATRSVINLRWPFTSYYVKEFDLDSEVPTYEEDGLLPCYKSMKSSASFPGRRRDVMLGRVWWVEWWAKDTVKDDDKEEERRDGGGSNNKAVDKEDNFEEIPGEMGHFEKEKTDSHL